MIDIPLGKALVPVETYGNKTCYQCALEGENCIRMPWPCMGGGRKDGNFEVARLPECIAAEVKK